jgi:hypothetical protein
VRTARPARNDEELFGHLDSNSIGIEMQTKDIVPHPLILVVSATLSR